MYILSMIVLIFFAVIGLSAFITAIIDSMHKCGNEEILIVLRKLTADNAEARIRKAARICAGINGARLICVCGSDEPAFRICGIMKNDYPCMELISERSFRDIFAG